MSTEEALTKYNDLAGKIFNTQNKKWRGQDGTFKASTLEAEIRNMIAGSHPGYTGEEFMFDNTAESETGKV